MPKIIPILEINTKGVHFFGKGVEKRKKMLYNIRVNKYSV
jgi:hypothetical protein